MKAWKATLGGKSWISHYGIVNSNQFLLEYKLGKTTYPKVGRLFVFSSYYSIYDFLYDQDCDKRNIVVFFGEAYNTRKIRRVSRLYRKEIIDFWACVRNSMNTMEAPDGTLTCSHFTPESQFSFHDFRSEYFNNPK